MTSAKWRSLALGWLFLLPACAEPEKPVEAPAAPSAVPRQEVRSASERAADLERKALERLRSARTIQYSVESGMETWSEEGSGTWGEEVARFSFERPNLVAIETPEFSMYCDGETLRIYVPDLPRHVELDAPERIDLNILEESGLQGWRSPPLLSWTILADPPQESLLTGVTEIAEVREMRMDGRGVVRVSGRRRISNPRAQGPIPFRIDYSMETGLPIEIRQDVSYYYAGHIREGSEGASKKKEGEGFRWDLKYETFSRFGPFLLNTEISEDRFASRPSDAGRISRFPLNDVRDCIPILEMIGKPAPGFTGKTLTDEEIALAKLRGRVVFLFFWQTSNRSDLLPEVQELHDKFRDHPVTVLGICNETIDVRDREENLKEYLDSKGITFPHIWDPEDEIGEKYPDDYPYLDGVIIDAQGIVQYAELEIPDDFVEEVGRRIRRLLAGETILDEAEIARRIEEQRERDAAWDRLLAE